MRMVASMNSNVSRTCLRVRLQPIYKVVRRPRVGLALLLSFALTTVLVPRAAGQDSASVDTYRFIVHWTGVPIECDSGSHTFPLRYLQERDHWYGAQLRATGQRSLCAESEHSEVVFRLTWIPTFDPTVMVRLDKRGANYTLHAATLSGAGGYEPGELRRDTTLALSEHDWPAWLSLVGSARFWEATTSQTDSAIGPDGKPVVLVGRDGARWLLEARRGTQYHAVDRWSPHAKEFMPFRRACEWLLHRSGLVDSALVAEY